ncbi:MAG: choice-of-anchor X domain-containing protein [candidate division KSB1 bacterium]
MKTSLLFFLLLCAAFCACNEEIPTQVEEQAPRIALIQAPNQAYQTPAQPVGIHVRVEDDQGVSDIAGVILNVRKSDTTPVASHNLRDDGQSGDILENDGQYFLAINAALTNNQTGTFVLEFTAGDKSNNNSAVAKDTLTILGGVENRLPKINSVNAPRVVWTDSSYTPQFLANATDPDGVNTIKFIVLEIYPPAFPKPARIDTLRDDGKSGDGAANDGAFGLKTNPARFGSACGLFNLVFRAVDVTGGVSAAQLQTLRITRVRLTNNTIPVLSEPNVPATISRSATPNTHVLSIQASDADAICDDAITRVFFNSFLPSGAAATGNPFAMRDDGKEGDAVANDGRYSLTIQITPQAATGTYRFEFQAQDRNGGLSEKMIRTINVTP